MGENFKSITTINSQPSIEEFENVVREIGSLSCGKFNEASDIFKYGVFMRPEVYAGYEFEDKDYGFDVPFPLNDCDTKFNDRVEYVKVIIGKILSREMEKPEWMKYVELNATCDEFNQPPSSFLYVIPKECQYEKLGDSLVKYLYSPNLMSSLYKR